MRKFTFSQLALTCLSRLCGATCNHSEGHIPEGIRSGMGEFIPDRSLTDWPEIIYVESCSFSDVPLCDVMNSDCLMCANRCCALNVNGGNVTGKFIEQEKVPG